MNATWERAFKASNSVTARWANDTHTETHRKRGDTDTQRRGNIDMEQRQIITEGERYQQMRPSQ